MTFQENLQRKLIWPATTVRYRLFNRLNKTHFIQSACRDCVSCNYGCCVYPFFDDWKIVLLPHEIRRISEYTGIAPQTFVDNSPLAASQQEYYDETNEDDPEWSQLFSLWKQPTGLKGKCPFLTPQGCTLPYQVKPFLCQVYPLTFNITKEMIYRVDDPDCLLIQAADTADDVLEHFQDSHERLRERLKEYCNDFNRLLNSLQVKDITA